MSDGDASDDLPLVMSEIRTIMGARSTVLTLHPENGGPPSVLHVDQLAGLDPYQQERLLAVSLAWREAPGPDKPRWVNCAADGAPGDAMLIPVKTIPGHSRLLVTVFFDDLTFVSKEDAEDLYAQRKPFAVGYFRLWQLSRQQERQISALGTALDRAEMGVLLIDRSHEVIFANRAASEVLTEGSTLRLHRGTLRAAQLRDSMRLQAAVEHVIAGNRTASPAKATKVVAPLLSLEREDTSPLMLSVLPAKEPATEPRDVAAIIFIVDPSRNVEELLQPVCRIYNLSPVESRLTCLLANGQALVDAAKAMRVKEATARTYLKQIFVKTGTRRQPELIGLMLSSVVRTYPAVLADVLSSTLGPSR